MLPSAMAQAPLHRGCSDRRVLRTPSRPTWAWLALALPVLLANPVAAASPPPAPTDVAGDSGRLVELPAPDAAPLSDTVTMPAGARIADVVGAEGTRPRIHVVAADGSGDSRVAQGMAPGWSPPWVAGGVTGGTSTSPRAMAAGGA